MTPLHTSNPVLPLEDDTRALLEAALPAYLPAQRWFGSKSKNIRQTSLTTIDHLHHDVFALTTIEVLYDDETSETYQLPLAVARGDETAAVRTASPKAVMATSNDGDAIFYDASVNPAFLRALMQLFITAAQANIEATTSGALPSASMQTLQPRLASAEQSNTSIFLGKSAILKLFRRLQPGANPEVEMTRFLTEVAAFKNIPAYLGELHSIHPPMTLAIMQAFAPNHGDGWEWYATELKSFFDAACKSTDDFSLQASARTAVEAARTLGIRTAEMHRGLATPTDDEAFASEEVSTASLASEQTRIEEQARKSLAALRQNLGNVPQTAQAAAHQLLDQQNVLLERCRFVDDHHNASYGKRIRIHGDYHLGQTLRTDDDFLIVDFEGEPALPLEQRSRKQSPLKDAAGMLRSFSYAAQSALAGYPEQSSETQRTLADAAHQWEKLVAETFLQTYKETIQPAPGLLPSEQESEAWLAALLLEKAMYELLYELNNRPAWVHIPLNGLLALTQ